MLFQSHRKLKLLCLKSQNYPLRIWMVNVLQIFNEYLVVNVSICSPIFQYLPIYKQSAFDCIRYISWTAVNASVLVGRVHPTLVQVASVEPEAIFLPSARILSRESVGSKNAQQGKALWDRDALIAEHKQGKKFLMSRQLLGAFQQQNFPAAPMKPNCCFLFLFLQPAQVQLPGINITWQGIDSATTLIP